MNEEILRAALRAGSDCPPVETLAAHLQAAEDDAARLAAERHLRECLHCRTELDLLREFEAGTIHPGEAAAVEWISARLAKQHPTPARVEKRPSRTLWSMPRMLATFASLAAIALLAIAISSRLELRRTASRPVPEFGNEAPRARTIDVIETPGYFTWQPVPGAARYDLTVRTVDDSVIFHNTFTSSSLAFPPEVAGVIKTGKLLLWEVIARDAAGNEIARSGIRRLRSAPQPAQ